MGHPDGAGPAARAHEPHQLASPCGEPPTPIATLQVNRPLSQEAF